MKRSLFVITLILLALSYSSDCNARQFFFRNFDIKNGLSQNTVHAILQDGQGFLWFGTKDGLNRFDGRNFRRVNVQGDDSNCSFISSLYEDSDGRIWVGAHHGACIYDPETESMEWFTAETPEGDRITTTPSSFIKAPDGSLLICVEDDGVFEYRNDDGSLRRKLRYRDYRMSNVNSIVFTPTGRAYLATFGQGIYYSDDNLESIHRLTDGNGELLFPHSVVNSMCAKGDKIYIATDNCGMHSIDCRTAEVAPVFINDEDGNVPIMRNLMLSGQSEIWIATESGVYIYDIAKGALQQHLTHEYFDKYSLSDNAIYCMITDRAGGIWLGSYFGGVDYLSRNPMQFDRFYRTNSPGSLQAERVRELCRDSDGIIYIGSEDRGLSSYNPSTGLFSRVAGIEEKNIHGLCIDDRDLWVGTFAEGIKVKNLDNGSVRSYTVRPDYSNGLSDNHVFSILRTIHGDIYIGSLSGLQRYDREHDRFENTEIGGFIYSLTEDSHGNIWVGTYSKGLYMLPPGDSHWQHFSTDGADRTSLPSNKVYNVQEDSRGNVWVMTQNGVCVYNAADGKFNRSFAGIDRIPGVVYSMVHDENDRYWLTSNHGIYCVDTKNGNLRNFTTADGLPTNQFNYSSSLRTPDGTIYFGSIDGLVAFNPLRYTSGEVPMNKPLVSELYIHGKLMRPGEAGSPLKSSISLCDVLALDPGQNSLSFRIATLNFDNSGEQRIKYRLLGFDDEWRYSSLDDGMLRYSNLNFGTYRLQVALCNDNNDQSGPMLDMEIKIATPFYLSAWAIAVYVLLAAAVIAFSLLYWRRYTLLQNQRYIDTYTSEKEREAFDSKIKFFTNVAHEIRTPLTLIKAPLDSVFQSKALADDSEARESLDVINLNVDRLLLLANQLLDFRKIENGNFQISKHWTDVKQLIEQLLPRFRPTISKAGRNLRVKLPDGPLMADVDAEAVTKIVSNLFTNAIKYGESYIDIDLTTDGANLILRFANDGVVVEPEKRELIFSLFHRLETNAPGTGIGLAYARSLAQMHKGTLSMDDSLDENVFVLILPVGEQENRPKEDSSETDLEYIARNSDTSVSVLLVEDNAEMLSFIEKKLIANNYRVFTATNGVEALAVLANNYIDIVVSDVMMPEMDGNELLGRIKNEINYSHIPVILLTAKTRMEDKLHGLDAGADAYIEKPFATEYLLATINSLLRNRERMRRRLEDMPLTKTHAKGLTKVDEDFLRKINEIIQCNFDNPGFSMEDVISALGMSRTTFYRKIKGMLDLNPNDYIKIQRLKRASQLFREGHTSVSEVCYMVGFSSPGYFTKCFQKQFGVSPKEFIAGKDKKNEA